MAVSAGGYQELTPWRPTCHDYKERNKISTPHIQKKDLEESKIHQNKAEHEAESGEGRLEGAAALPSRPIRSSLVDRAITAFEEQGSSSVKSV
jgi:hypothetical protein